MADKKELIMETAAEIISKKGYYAASIQEIATASGLSKGSFYLYFKSKEELFEEIIKFYLNKLKTTIKEIDELSIDPREKFVKRTAAVMDVVLKRGNHIFMQRHDIDSSVGKNIEMFLLEQREQGKRDTMQALLEIYGESVTDYVYDLRIMAEGIHAQYVSEMLLDGLVIDVEAAARFILARIDNIVAGMKQAEAEPLITAETLYTSSLYEEEIKTREIQQYLEKMQLEITKLDYKKNDVDELEGVLQAIKEELFKEDPKGFVLQGLLANFKEIPPLNQLRQELSAKLGIKVL